MATDASRAQALETGSHLSRALVRAIDLPFAGDRWAGDRRWGQVV